MIKNSIFVHHTGHMWGLGCFAYSKKAINKIAEIKNRSDAKGFIVLTYDKQKLINNCLDKKLKRVMQQYWPGNITVAMPNFDENLKHLEFEGTVAFRVPSSKSLRDFLKKHDEPIISTSVNISGEEHLTCLKQIKTKFKHKFNFVANTEDICDLKPSTLIKQTAGGIQLIRNGSANFDEIFFSYNMPLITFMCTGNTCRSPLAQYYANALIKQKNLSFRVQSAGTLSTNSPISENSKQVLKAIGINTCNHVSKQINADMLNKSYLVIVMEESHKKYITDNFEFAKTKTFTLAEICNLKQDIKDPYGLDYDTYLKTFVQIKHGIDYLFTKADI